MTTFTRNLGLAKPEFDKSTWHDDLNSNFDILDATLASMGIYMNLRGLWENAAQYQVEDRVVDPIQNNVFRCVVAHASPATGTFVQDRLANPNRWILVSSGLVPRGLWQPETGYVQNDLAFDLDEGFVGLCMMQHTSSDAPSIRTDANLGLWMPLVDLKQAIDTVADYTGQTQVMYDEIVEIEQTVLAAEVAVIAALSAYPPGGTSGQALIKQSNADFDATWAALPGGGDMLQSVYDPEGLGANLATPAGVMVAYGGETVPAGWSVCDGGELSRSTESRLYTAIGTIWGAGNGTTTFNKPDLRNRFLRGVGSSTGALGSFQDAQVGEHGHTGSVEVGGAHSHTGSTASAGGHTHTGMTNTTGAHTHTGSTNTTGAHTHNVLGRTLAGTVTGLNRAANGDTNTGSNTTLSNAAASNGNHSHTLSIDSAGDHSHTLSINSAGAHTHTVTIDEGGAHAHDVTIDEHGVGQEPRPTNAAIYWIIKL